ncbi:universal stress protein [Oceanidesulfovibrio marinus]|uniref:Universal stress protein n=1 Tax=Oceanidesulfovibrio marinus TaxID=370038 RepID=A0A6P1ZHB9_9BACT|nr:universal stress protein [Oceanidesulfovibrio marinus]QJT09440.1 universal stress protein [Oceanidesulfovibrio marinus]TVM33663.1 universal stress protein [Oceanidesulfovibrio marinus]
MPSLLHIFRNTPFGRETLLNSLYFCETLGLDLKVYIPRMPKFLMYFEYEAVQVDLDGSYLNDPDTAVEHLNGLTKGRNLVVDLLETKEFTASTLPDVPTNVEFMTSPRIIADKSTSIALGIIGSKVRTILKTARFPVLIPPPVYKPWQSVAVFFGGSVNAVKSFYLGLRIARDSGLPLDVFTVAKEDEREKYEEILAKNELSDAMAREVRIWDYRDVDFAKLLYDVPHDALVVLGAYGHGIIKEMLFGSKMELVQSVLPNPLLVAGPNFKTHPWYQTETARLLDG